MLTVSEGTWLERAHSVIKMSSFVGALRPVELALDLETSDSGCSMGKPAHRSSYCDSCEPRLITGFEGVKSVLVQYIVDILWSSVGCTAVKVVVTNCDEHDSLIPRGVERIPTGPSSSPTPGPMAEDRPSCQGTCA
jgi:hypothetical protein